VPSGGEAPKGTPGVADKCTWCYHRISRGQQPACVEVCPMSARIFGDLNDPYSRVNDVLRQPGIQVLKPELGTKPKVYYLGLETEVG
jgi:Fe-S-cluster-containing dehydrogenase component